mgnify:CR=1 FL=1
MIKLYEYLISNYKPNEPIFVSDLQISISDANLQQMFNLLCDSGKIKRFDTGIYYLPKESRLTGGVPLGADTVARYKYVSRNGRIDGYYSGYTFANQLGVITQVPYTLEIVSNNASAKVQEVNLQGRKVILRKAKIPVTKENYKILQFLDFLKDVELYMDKNNEVYINGKKIKENYIKENMNTEDLSIDIPKGKVFVMGDNRNHSLDSRKLGYFDFDNDVIGKVFFKIPL